jgi:NAD(P)-dependent dehydrogenase (short-subunit alcohol dehydrogenase family)
MELKDKVVVVTGGASGIGRALCRRFVAEGARGVMVADLDGPGADLVAKEIGGHFMEVNVGHEAEINELVSRTVETYGPIDLFCSNAGIAIDGGVEVPDPEWRRIIDVNFMAHLYAARAVIPSMLERKQGYILATASAAGVLTQIGSAPYAVTKHMAVALAEWIAMTYGDSGIKVSCLCPQGVKTGMLNENSGPSFLMVGAIEAEQVAETVVAGLREERFLILPHPEVAEYMQRKASDYDRWLRGMRRLQARIREALEKLGPQAG